MKVLDVGQIVAELAGRQWSSFTDDIQGRRRRRQWQRAVEESLVLFPGEEFRRAYRVGLPMGDPVTVVGAVLVITTSRLLVLSEGHLYIEYGIEGVAQAYTEAGKVFFTLRGDEGDFRVAVQADEAEALQKHLVAEARRRLTGSHRARAIVPQVVAEAVHLAAEIKRDQTRRGPREQ